ncbi:MAG: hypothetical protein ABIS17_02735 [Casimicrobiaceae bacterium]
MSPNATRTLRRIVLIGALLAALGMSVVLEPATVRAQSPTTAGSTAAAPPASTTRAAPATPTTNPPGNAVDSKADGAASRVGSADGQSPSAGAKAGDAAGKDTADSDRTVVIEKDGKRVQVTRSKKGGKDRSDLDTFPYRGPPTGMIVAIVAIVFLSPALIVGLFISYRLRKARMLNETMLKLAELGAVAPAEAIQALSSGQPPPGLAAAAAAAAGTAALPLADHVRQIQHRATTADLRKAVILGAVGLGFILYSLFDDGSPNFVGLVLAFLGAGYGVLWWFETRHAERIAQGPGSTQSQP